MDEQVSEEELNELQRLCGTPYKPTQLTYQLRMAISGDNKNPPMFSHAYMWQDKPHRLVTAACAEIERLQSMLDEHEAVKLR